MKKSLILILLFVCMPFSIAKDVSVEEVNKKVLDVENILTEEVDEGVTRYVYGSGLVASVKDSEINYYHSDRIQSNRLITTSFGEIENEFLSLPFGQLIVNSGIRYAFATGKELDESDLYYFGVRYYDSDLGRFTSVDPVKENEPYSYVRNNPLYFVDPSGMDEEVQQEMNWFENPSQESAVNPSSEQLEEAILNSLNSATKTIENGGIVPCTAGACSVADEFPSLLRKPLTKLLEEPKADKQYENVFGEVTLENGRIITSEDIKNNIFTELTLEEAQSFADKGGLVLAMFHGQYLDDSGNVKGTIGHTVVIAPNTESIRAKIDTSKYPGGDKFNQYPIVFHTGAGDPRIVTLNWAFRRNMIPQVRFVISTAEYNDLNN